MNNEAQSVNLGVTAPPLARTHSEDTPMPPPKRRKEQNRTTGVMSIYVKPEVGIPIGGFRSKPMSQAIKCWAHVLIEATIANSKAFSAKEWQFLAQSAVGREDDFEPSWSKPGELLGEVAGRGLHLGFATVLGQKAEDKVQELADRLRQLDYVRAWALIWAVQYRRDVQAPIDSADWWTLAHRQQQQHLLLPKEKVAQTEKSEE